MANEGYLIGYEDAQGNFVQIGQFNNVADDITQPIVLRHTNSGATLKLDGSSLRPSTQIGETTNRQNVFADTVDSNTVESADELRNPTYATLSDVPTTLPEGTQVYVEDENSIYIEDGT